MSILTILLIEDNEETLNELKDTLPTTVNDHKINWETCNDFEQAQLKIALNRYDLIVTDIYIDARGQKRSLSMEETGAGEAIELIRSTRFCPILAMTDGSKPDKFPLSPFIGFADKSKPASIEQGLKDLLNTGISQLARRVHDEIDADAGKYLWDFLENKWQSLINDDPLLLERLIRRRVSILVSRLNTDGLSTNEIEIVEGLEFYIYPPIANNDLRLGEILRKRDSPEEGFIVVLTPHCHLTVQSDAIKPRADYVLTVSTLDARELIATKHPVKGKKTQAEINESVRKRIQGPAGVGIPAGRYWFLPGFIEIPDLYCDFLRINSISFDELKTNYESIAVLDTPFAESLQSSFTSFYSAIGTPNLNPSRFMYLVSGNTSSD